MTGHRFGWCGENNVYHQGLSTIVIMSSLLLYIIFKCNLDIWSKKVLITSPFVDKLVRIIIS